MDVDVVDSSISPHRPLALRFSSEPGERRLKLQRAAPLPPTWPEGPTVPANVNWAAVQVVTEETSDDASTATAADAVYRGAGAELGTRYALERPPDSAWNPPTKARGGKPVIVWAASKGGKPFAAPRTRRRQQMGTTRRGLR